jgi:hypothetical protein
MILNLPIAIASLVTKADGAFSVPPWWSERLAAENVHP